MTIPIKIISNEPEQEEMFSITLEARKTLDGKIMIFDHKRIDIVIDLENRKIVTFPKDEINDETYFYQSRYLEYLAKKGVIIPESIQSGNVYASLQGTYPEAKNQNLDSSEIVLLSTFKFIEKENPLFETEDWIDQEIEDYLVDPSDEDSTSHEDAIDTHKSKKGSINPYRIRKYLTGYGLFE